MSWARPVLRTCTQEPNLHPSSPMLLRSSWACSRPLCPSELLPRSPIVWLKQIAVKWGAWMLSRRIYGQTFRETWKSCSSQPPPELRPGSGCVYFSFLSLAESRKDGRQGKHSGMNSATIDHQLAVAKTSTRLRVCH